MTSRPPAPEDPDGPSAPERRFPDGAGAPGRELESRQEVVRMLEGYLEQLEQGSPPEPKVWLARHAGLSGPLDEYLATLELLHREALNLGQGPPAGAAPPPAETALGQLGDYRLLRELGRGGNGDRL